jgi:ribose transport system substrate-binding protein
MYRMLDTRRRRRLAGSVALVVVALSTAAAAFAGGGPTAKQLIASAGQTSDKSFCGHKNITVGYTDGFGINAWSAYTLAAFRLEAAKCPNVKVISIASQGDLQKSISDINSLVSQGVNAIVTVPDFGPAELPAIKSATASGVKVVAVGASPGGTPGTDYVAYVDWNPKAAGAAFARWMVKALHGKGNVLYIGGPAGNPVGVGMLAGMKSVLPKYPHIKMLSGYTSWVVDNWDAATAAKDATALLAKYPKIDGIFSEGELEMPAVMRVFANAKRPLPAFTAIDGNVFGCAYKKYKSSNASLQAATISSRNWLGRIAARKAIAAAEGLTNNEPSIFNLPLYEDSLKGGMAPRCVPSRPPTASFSSQMTDKQVATYGKFGN